MLHCWKYYAMHFALIFDDFSPKIGFEQVFVGTEIVLMGENWGEPMTNLKK